MMSCLLAVERNLEWCSKLPDITEHLNNLNLKLQGKKQNICQLMSHIEAFRKKVTIFEELKRSDLKFFKSCNEIKSDLNCVDFTQFVQYVAIIAKLREEFEERFSNFLTISRPYSNFL